MSAYEIDCERLRDALDHAGILHREKSLGNHDVENDRQHQRAQRDQQRDRLVAQNHLQRPPVKRDHALEHAFRDAIEARLLLLRIVLAECARTSSASGSAKPPPKS